MKKGISIILFLIAIGTCSWAQSPRSRSTSHNNVTSDTTSKTPEGINYDHVDEADTTLCNAVYLFTPNRRSVKLTHLEHPVINPTGVAFPNIMDAFNGDYYLYRGGIGKVQYSLFPTPGNLKFSFQPNANPALTRLLGTPTLYQVQRPFTTLGYGSSINQDLMVKVSHTQNIKPRWNVAFDVDLIKSDGLYTQSALSSTFFDVTTNYYSPDARYQVQAGIVRNRQSQEENGGVVDDITCWDSPSPSGVPVKMYDAANEWKDLTLFVHQSLNTVRQFEWYRPIYGQDTVVADSVHSQADSTIKGQHPVDGKTIIGYDTIQPHKPHFYNTGVFGLDLQYDKKKRNFYDNSPSAELYDHFFYSTDKSWDSTLVRELSADIYWTNDAYMSHRWVNPLVVAGGLKPHYSYIRYTDNVTTDQFFTVEAHVEGRFELKKFRLEVEASEVSGSYRNGDYRLLGRMTIGRALQIEALSQAHDPDHIYYRYLSNNHQWDNADYKKIKDQSANIRYRIQMPDTSKSFLRHLEVKAQGQIISDNIWINSQMLPQQGDETGALGQFSLTAKMQKGWFHCDMQQMVQYSTNDAVVRVPLFASKNSLYAEVKVFHNALWLQSGFELRYHTKYYADGWSPALGTFYRQDEVEIGNYLWADFFTTIQVKQASIYVKVSHFNAPLEQNPHYFILPHHPGEDLGVYWGVVWKFFN